MVNISIPVCRYLDKFRTWCVEKLRRLYVFVYVYMWTCITLKKNNLLFKLYARWITYHSYNVLASLGNNVWLVLQKCKNGRISVPKRTVSI